jgi:hypothetical protein
MFDQLIKLTHLTGLLISVSDPHTLYADPDPAFLTNADPDPEK